MVWGYIVASGSAQITVIDGKMNSQVFQIILQENLGPSVRQPKLSKGWVMR